MRPSKPFYRITLIFLLCNVISLAGFSQLTMVRAYNTACYYHTNSASVFTWNGGCEQSYCHGYGTIQWYDNGTPIAKYVGNIQYGKNDGFGTLYYANGGIRYTGYWKNDMENGYGTYYSQYGDTLFHGYFSNDQISNYYFLDLTAKKLTEYIVAKLFDGGINIKYQLVKAVYDNNDALEEIRVRMTFNGDIVTTNYYDGTLVINLKKPYVDFVNYNENFQGYATLKLTATIIDEINKMTKENK